MILYKKNGGIKMPATEKMCMYAKLIAVCLEKELPDFESFKKTHDFISDNVEEFKKLDSQYKEAKKREIWNMHQPEQDYSVKTRSLKINIGKWIAERFEQGKVPFDCIENINSVDRRKLAFDFWESKIRSYPPYGLAKKLDEKECTQEEIIDFIAHDMDYRLAKATAKYMFGLTDRSAGAVLINPNDAPFNQIKFQYRKTFYRLEEEWDYRKMRDNEFREGVK